MKSWDHGLLHEYLIETVRQSPWRPLLEEGESRHSYAEIFERAASLAHGLRREGLCPGDAVLIYVGGGATTAIALFATLLAGGVFVLVHPQTRREKLEFLLRDSEARFALMDQPREALLGPVLSGCFAEGAGPRGVSFGEATGLLSVAALSKHGPLLEPASRESRDLAALIYTSGSTGRPKAVMMTHRSMRFACETLCGYLRLGAEDRILNVLPLSFDYGLYQLLMAVRLGATLVHEPSFAMPAPILAALGTRGITVFPGVPTVFALLLSMQRRRPSVFPELRCLTNTAAALPVEFLPDLQAMFPNARIYKMYGLTECKRVSYLDPELLEQKPGSVGRAIPGTQAFLLDEAGRRVAPGEEGLLYVRGPHVMLGYWKRPEESAQMLPEGAAADERLLCTQDRFRCDEDGDLFFVGRSDDIIKSRGEKVSPLEIEHALHRIPGVSLAAVVGVPDPILGQAIQAFVVLQPGSSLSEEELIEEARQRLEPALVPRRILVEKKLPLAATGKVDKKALSSWGAKSSG
ncbi:MAG: long chain acyl-CoA synthetase [Planctomycetota bacterium]|nr:MAG: long chain acyl-CoA synthetase [Planctomycetota bacterium]